jgi:hypothetical protein
VEKMSKLKMPLRFWCHRHHHRHFQSLLSDIDAAYGDVLYRAEVLLLSRGTVFKRFRGLETRNRNAPEQEKQICD